MSTLKTPLINEERGKSGSRLLLDCCGCICCVATTIILMMCCVGIVLAIFFGLAARYMYSAKISFNIHIYLDEDNDCRAKTTEFNKILRENDENEWLNFVEKEDNITLSEPHITLYLTDFYFYRFYYIAEALQEVAKTYTEECIVNFKADQIKKYDGTYAMWDSEIPQCLQDLSDQIVNSTMKYVHNDAKTFIPELPEDLRKLKEKMIHDYGSPNVFSEFTPHITYGVDQKTPEVQNAVVKTLQESDCSTTVKRIEVSRTLGFGSIEQGSAWFGVNIPSE